MVKKSIIITFLITTLFVSCSNFMNGSEVLEELQKAIEIANAPTYSISFFSRTGSFLTGSQYDAKVDVPFKIEYKMQNDLTLAGFTAINKYDSSCSMNDYIKFGTINYNNNVITVEITLLQPTNDITIEARTYTSPETDNIKPEIISSDYKAYINDTLREQSLTKIPFNKFGVNEDLQNSVVKRNDFAQNHIRDKIQIKMTIKEGESGVNPIKEKDLGKIQIIETLEQNYSYVNCNEKNISYCKAPFIPMVKDGYYEITFDYTLKINTYDGEVKLDFIIYDNAGNASKADTIYVISDRISDIPLIGLTNVCAAELECTGSFADPNSYNYKTEISDDDMKKGIKTISILINPDRYWKVMEYSKLYTIRDKVICYYGDSLTNMKNVNVINGSDFHIYEKDTNNKSKSYLKTTFEATTELSNINNFDKPTYLYFELIDEVGNVSKSQVYVIPGKDSIAAVNIIKDSNTADYYTYTVNAYTKNNAEEENYRKNLNHITAFYGYNNLAQNNCFSVNYYKSNYQVYKDNDFMKKSKIPTKEINKNIIWDVYSIPYTEYSIFNFRESSYGISLFGYWGQIKDCTKNDKSTTVDTNDLTVSYDTSIFNMYKINISTKTDYQESYYAYDVIKEGDTTKFDYNNLSWFSIKDNPELLIPYKTGYAVRIGMIYKTTEGYSFTSDAKLIKKYMTGPYFEASNNRYYDSNQDIPFSDFMNRNLYIGKINSDNGFNSTNATLYYWTISTIEYMEDDSSITKEEVLDKNYKTIEIQFTPGEEFSISSTYFSDNFYKFALEITDKENITTFCYAGKYHQTKDYFDFDCYVKDIVNDSKNRVNVNFVFYPGLDLSWMRRIICSFDSTTNKFVRTYDSLSSEWDNKDDKFNKNTFLQIFLLSTEFSWNQTTDIKYIYTGDNCNVRFKKMYDYQKINNDDKKWTAFEVVSDNTYLTYIIYSKENYESEEMWNLFGCKTQFQMTSGTSYLLDGNDDYMVVPHGFYYRAVVHFADGTTMFSEPILQP